MSYAVRTDTFEGPLDALLQLVEAQELPITNISLVAVTEPFVAYVRQEQGMIPLPELADFLLIAAKLIYLKSKALMPDLHDPELEEGPSLEDQLRLYQQFVNKGVELGAMVRQHRGSFGRVHRVVQTQPGFYPPTISATDLRAHFERVITRLVPLATLPKTSIERAVSIEEKIEDLRTRVKALSNMSFHRYLAQAKNKDELVVSFLALLELIKQRLIVIEQRDLFEEIHLQPL